MPANDLEHAEALFCYVETVISALHDAKHAQKRATITPFITILHPT